MNIRFYIWLYNKCWDKKDPLSPISKVFKKRGAWGEKKLFSKSYPSPTFDIEPYIFIEVKKGIDFGRKKKHKKA